MVLGPHGGWRMALICSEPGSSATRQATNVLLLRLRLLVVGALQFLSWGTPSDAEQRMWHDPSEMDTVYEGDIPIVKTLESCNGLASNERQLLLGFN